MKKEYKNCPKCHIINAPNAVKCECGYVFSEDEALSDKDIARSKRASTKRNVITGVVFVALFALYVALSLRFGFLIVLLYSIGFVILALLVLYVLSKIKSKLDRKRLDD